MGKSVDEEAEQKMKDLEDMNYNLESNYKGYCDMIEQQMVDWKVIITWLYFIYWLS